MQAVQKKTGTDIFDRYFEAMAATKADLEMDFEDIRILIEWTLRGGNLEKCRVLSKALRLYSKEMRDAVHLVRSKGLGIKALD